MPLQKNPYPLRIEDELMAKFKTVAKNNGRSVNKEVEQIMRIAVSNYEKENGEITIDVD